MTRAALFILAFFSWAPALDARETEPNLKIGVILPLSGGMAPYGKDLLQGMETALEQLKADDPKKAEHINMAVQDNRGLVKATEDATRELVNKSRTPILIGPLVGSTSETAAAIAEELKRPLLLPAMAGTKLPGAGKTTFRTSLTDADQGAALAQFAGRQLRIRTVLILAEEKNPYAQAVTDGFSAAWKKRGGEILAVLPYARGTQDFSTHVQKILELKPGAVVAPGSVQDVARILVQAKTGGIKVPFLGTDSWDSKDLHALAGEAYRGHYFLTHFSPLDPAEAVKRFAEAYQRRYQTEPNALAAMGYDAMRVAIEAFVQAQSNMESKLLKVIPHLNVGSSLFGRLTFTKDGRAQKPAVVLVTTAEGPRFMARTTIEDERP